MCTQLLAEIIGLLAQDHPIQPNGYVTRHTGGRMRTRWLTRILVKQRLSFGRPLCGLANIPFFR